MVLTTACGTKKLGGKKDSQQDPNVTTWDTVETILFEDILVEDVLVEEIEVEGITVEGIKIK